MFKSIFSLTAVFLLLVGCQFMPPYEPVDFGKKNDGRIYIRDTERSWGYLKDSIDSVIRDEVAKKSPSAGFRDWNELWVWNINKKLHDGSLENPERYIEYIISARRASNLPELVYDGKEVKME